MRKFLRIVAFLIVINLTVNAGFDYASRSGVDPHDRELKPSGGGCGEPQGICG